MDLCRMRGVDPRAVASAFVEGGARLLQVRQKTPGSAAFLACVREVSAAAGRGVGVIVNDRADIAAIAGAAGVHIGQHDLPVAAVRGIAGAGRVVGVSTHDPAQIDAAAAAGVDYIAVGPVFQTVTKETGYAPRGLELVRYAAATGRPVVAIGGITLETAGEVLAAGAAAVAVISDLLTGGDPAVRVRRYLDVLESR